MTAKKGMVFIGTSGFHYKHWVGTYYPKKTKPEDYFKFYLQDFSTVELNNPFYHLPTLQTFIQWKKQTPKEFIFSVKASRYITHNKKLKDPEEPLHNFLANASGLKEKLGPVLFQLPPGWKFNGERLNAFLEQLPKRYRFVFEFRNPTWYNQEAFDMLRKYKAAFCIYELAGHSSPLEVTSDFVYIRLHGPGEQKYQGSYSRQTLQAWAQRIKKWSKEGKDVYCYFDNDQAGYAAFNAIQLSELLPDQVLKAI